MGSKSTLFSNIMIKQYSFLQESNINIDPKILSKFKTGLKHTMYIGGTAKGISLSITFSILSKKINELIKQISKVDTREEAVEIINNCAYVPDKEIEKKVSIASINYFLSNSIGGPAIAIIKNENDPNWKPRVLKYLKTMRNIKLANSVASGIGTGVLATTYIKGLKK